jgi:signal transduction histidine kinase
MLGNNNRLAGVMGLFLALTTLLSLFSCSGEGNREADFMNDKAYCFHYISLDSTTAYATKALAKSAHYDAGHNEAMNNLAFVDLMKMDYKAAEKKLKGILAATDNQIELLVANTQMMRLCQRQSRNKDFYEYYWNATNNLERINEDRNSLSERLSRRVDYAESEMKIVLSAYLYYVGQTESSVAALDKISEDGNIRNDTAQLLNYYYNVGTGEYLTLGTPMERSKKEFDYLTRCYLLAQNGRYIYWEANALQAMSEHLQNEQLRDSLVKYNTLALKILGVEDVDTALIAEDLAQRSLEAFVSYGDVYQIAGALRTLSDCHFQEGDYQSAADCLHEAIVRDARIDQAPSLKSSIYEKLSINYSALNEKKNSDFYRNLYLDMQESTRQDRELEARAEQLDRMSLQLNLMITGVLVGIVLLIALLIVFAVKRRRKEKAYTSEQFLKPLEEWKMNETHVAEAAKEHFKVIEEEQKEAEFALERNMQKNIGQRAKMSLVNSITPFIDRMLAEIHLLKTRNEDSETKNKRYDYILELTDKINEYNDVLTGWIQLRKGDLNLHLESFRLQELFDIVKEGRSSFAMKDVALEVADTNAVVKADKTLTLFMINTMADNARKAVKEHGKVRVYADETADFVEIAIADNGEGMDEEQLKGIFQRQLPDSGMQHGFGLMNCKGIIEKYKKVSKMFSVCNISAESRKWQGAVFKFRLPHGKLRTIVLLLAFATSFAASAARPVSTEDKIKMYADSAYFCNLQGKYERTIEFSRLACRYLNEYYRAIVPNGKDTLRLVGTLDDKASELKWFGDSLRMPYNVILDMRNEVAVAALALHDWDTYNYNNNLFVRLFRECSADYSLAKYVQQTQLARDGKNVAVILLTILLVCIIPAYYVFYYRYVVHYRSLVDRVNRINAVLFDRLDDTEKLQKIRTLWKESGNTHYEMTKETAALDRVVGEVCRALEDNIKVRRKENDSLELAEDELKRIRYEAQRLYIYNNVLDNCFSALKHETMYYPSRIRQIVEKTPDNISALGELTGYYKKLYVMLSMQAQSQLTANLKINGRLLAYLRTLLLKLSAGETPSVSMRSVDEVYDSYILKYGNLVADEVQARNFFTPLTCNLQGLQIRQIVREIGETTGKRGCGVQARQGADGTTEIIMTLWKRINPGFDIK